MYSMIDNVDNVDLANMCVCDEYGALMESQEDVEWIQ